MCGGGWTRAPCKSSESDIYTKTRVGKLTKLEDFEGDVTVYKAEIVQDKNHSDYCIRYESLTLRKGGVDLGDNS